MPERVCLWMQSVACYFIFQSALLHFLPEGSYKKYIQFYMGLLFIWVLIVTGGKLLGAEETMFEVWCSTLPAVATLAVAYGYGAARRDRESKGMGAEGL